MSDKIELHTQVAQRHVAVAAEHVTIAWQRLAAVREHLALAQAQVPAAREEVARAQEQVAAATEGIRALQPLVLGPAAAARVLGIDRTMLYRLLASDALKSLKIGRRRLVPVSELEDFVRRQIEESA